MSTKFQTTFPEDLMFSLRTVASEQGSSVAELIRVTMTDFLRTRKATSDPFAGITGLVASDEVDLSSRVDEVLYR